MSFNTNLFLCIMLMFIIIDDNSQNILYNNNYQNIDDSIDENNEHTNSIDEYVNENTDDFDEHVHQNWELLIDDNGNYYILIV